MENLEKVLAKPFLFWYHRYSVIYNTKIPMSALKTVLDMGFLVWYTCVNKKEGGSSIRDDED